MSKEADYAVLFKALSDETRLQILKILRSGDKSMTEMLDQFQLSQPTISYHIAIMKEANLIKRTSCGTIKKCSLNRELFKEVEEWFHKFNQELE